MEELPRGIKIASDVVKVRQKTKVMQPGCPVIAEYNKRARSQYVEGWSIERTPPDKTLGLTFVPKVKLADVEKFHILSALEYCGGSLASAARLLNIGRATIYKKMREWKSETK